jgi:hypothetical protein
MSRLLLQRRGTFSRACTGGIKIAYYGDVRFKQRAVTEFIVAEKASVTNIHKGLKMYRVLSAVDKSTLSLGFANCRF